MNVNRGLLDVEANARVGPDNNNWEYAREFEGNERESMEALIVASIKCIIYRAFGVSAKTRSFLLDVFLFRNNN